MKKVLSTYIFIIVFIIIISAFFSHNKYVKYEMELPEKINVYFKEEKATKEVVFEEYLVNVVAAEMPASFHEEAIKAQSVAARTYIYNKYINRKENSDKLSDEHKDAVICNDSTHCCAYLSNEGLEAKYGREWMNSYYNKIKKCVEETCNEVIIYEGTPIVASFHASSGGCRTENSQDVWSSSLPYLVSVESAGEDKREGYNSTVVISGEEFKNKINEKYPDAKLDGDRNKWLGDISYTQGNSVDKIKIGEAYIKGTQIRSLFGLKSACFEISMLNDEITFNVHGSGHGVGLSQYGANIMANGGKNYADILKWYYTGVEIKK